MCKKRYALLLLICLCLISGLSVYAQDINTRSMPVSDSTGFEYRGTDGNTYWFRTTIVGRNNSDNDYFANYSFCTTYLYEDNDYIYILCDKKDSVEADNNYSIYITVTPDSNDSSDKGDQLNRNYHIELDTINDEYKGYRFKKGEFIYGFSWDSLYDLQQMCNEFASDPDCSTNLSEVRYLETIHNSAKYSDDFYTTHLLIKNQSVHEMGENYLSTLKDLSIVGICIMTSFICLVVLKKVLSHFIGGF